MDSWKLWFARLVVLAVAGLFMLISFKFVVDPQHAADAAGIMPVSAVGYTNTRAGFGGFPLGFAAILLFCALSPRRLLPALAAIATVAAAILAVRVYGAVLDGSLRESARLLIPEAAILAAALLGSLLEFNSSRRSTDPGSFDRPQSRF